LASDRVTAGDLAVLRVTVADPISSIKVEGWEREIKLFRLGNDYVALIPVSYRDKPGPREISLNFSFSGGRTQALPLRFEVVAGEFPVQRLTVRKDQQALLSDPRREEDAKKVASARRRTASQALWEGLFVQPVEGRLSTGYGQIRYVNGTETGRHSGIDLAIAQGTPVKAANNGRVVLVDNLVVTGKTIIVDHGLNLFTSYSHLSTTSVDVGDEVQKGQVIGEVGSTGFSTGPHLHFAATVGSTPTNPLVLFGRDLLTP
jgi:murein DD-endopeptidase MepM/ murein hydrolase activator NlpD